MQVRWRWWRLVGALAVPALGVACGGDSGTGSDAGGGDSGAPAADVAVDTGNGAMDVAMDTGGGNGDAGTDAGPGMDVTPRCGSNADCTGSAGGGVCDTASGVCVQCVATADTCPAAQHCDAASHACVGGCRGDDGCTGGDGGVGDGGVGGHCDTTVHVCVQCLTSDQCAPGTVCTAHACVPGCAPDHGCGTGLTCCGTVCVDTTTSTANCGGCGTTCMASHDSPGCAAGRCTVGTCDTGFADCNAMVADGCEVDTRVTLASCGGCGTACAPANATGACVASACTVASCTAGFTDCNAMAVDGCEVHTAADLANCGTCAHSCPLPTNATAQCTAGTCGFTCTAGFADCNAMVADGCEADIRTDVNNCGACGHACAFGQGCTAGACQFGDGSAGALTVSGTQVLNGTAASASGTAGSTAVALSHGVGTFTVGQEVLLHQTQAAAGPVGQYEFGRVMAATAAALTLSAPLVNTYVTDATHHAQVIAVPQYTTVTVPAGAVLTARAWDGNSGGILVLDASGAVTVGGTVQMDGGGFRGNHHACGSAMAHCARGTSGESALGPGRPDIAANGAGGGGGGAGQDCAAGGGGGYAIGGDQGTAGTVPGVCAEAAVAGLIPPGNGGVAVGTASLAATVLFGGAGGEGGLDEDGALPGNGGNGGGAVILRGGTVTVSGAGVVSVAGTLGGDGSSSGTTCAGAGGCGMGGGGGGAGGAVRIVAATSASVGTRAVRSTGGDGGQCSCGNDHPGGIGGTGRIGVLSPMVTGTTNPTYDPG